MHVSGILRMLTNSSNSPRWSCLHCTNEKNGGWEHRQLVQVMVRGQHWIRSAWFRRPCFHSTAWWGLCWFREGNVLGVYCLHVCVQEVRKPEARSVVCFGPCLCECLYLLVPLSLDPGVNPWANTYVLPVLGAGKLEQREKSQWSKIFQSNPQQPQSVHPSRGWREFCAWLFTHRKKRPHPRLPETNIHTS